MIAAQPEVRPVRVPGAAARQADLDKVTASLTDGILTITVPKAEADKPHRIQITAG